MTLETLSSCLLMKQWGRGLFTLISKWWELHSGQIVFHHLLTKLRPVLSQMTQRWLMIEMLVHTNAFWSLKMMRSVEDISRATNLSTGTRGSHFNMNKHQCQVDVLLFVQTNVHGVAESSRTRRLQNHMSQDPSKPNNACMQRSRTRSSRWEVTKSSVMAFVSAISVKLILTIWWSTTIMHSYMASLVQDSFCSPETKHVKMLPTNVKFGLKRNQDTSQGGAAHKVCIIQGGAANHPPILVPIAKQLLKISRQVAVLRTITFLDVAKGTAMDRPHADGSQGISKKARVVLGHRSLEFGFNSMRHLGSNGGGDEKFNARRSRSQVPFASPIRVGEAFSAFRKQWRKEDGQRNHASAVQSSIQARQGQVGGNNHAKYPKPFILEKSHLSLFGVTVWIQTEWSGAKMRSEKKIQSWQPTIRQMMKGRRQDLMSKSKRGRAMLWKFCIRFSVSGGEIFCGLGSLSSRWWDLVLCIGQDLSADVGHDHRSLFAGAPSSDMS